MLILPICRSILTLSVSETTYSICDGRIFRFCALLFEFLGIDVDCFSTLVVDEELGCILTYR